MADVIGPNSYLPGSAMTRQIPEGTVCDTHSDRPAVSEIVGETDSFGSETWYCCKECVTESRNAPPRTGTCDWCKTANVIVHPHRDWEEGRTGRVYDVCDGCIRKENERLAEELGEDEDMEVYDGHDYDGVYTDERARY